MIFQQFPHTNVLRRKFDLAIIRSKVNLLPLFEQNLYTLSPRCYIPRFSLKAFLILEKKIFKLFYHIWAWQPSCSVGGTIQTNYQYPFYRRPHMKTCENCSVGRCTKYDFSTFFPYKCIGPIQMYMVKQI